MANNASLSVLLTGTDKLTPTIKNAQKALTELNTKGTKLDSVQKNFDKITNSSAPLSKKIRDIKKQMETLIVTGQKETAEGKKMWEEMAKAARHYDDQLKQIQKDTKNVSSPGGGNMKGLIGGMADKAGLGQLGTALSNPYVLAGAAAVGATKAIYDYGVELDRTLQKTAQFTGLSGNELQSLRAGIKSVATTWGKDYDEVLSGVDGLMSQFGITGEQALKLIRDGFASGADDSGRMLDMISKYGGAFHDAGISADELVAIIQNTRSGIFSEDGMELFSKGATKIREFSDKLRGSLEEVGINAEKMYQQLQSGEISTVQAIQQISVKLKELPPQSQQVGDVLKQVFGKDGAKAGYEMVTALADVETNLETILEGLTEDQKATVALQEANREFESALASLFGTANGGFSTMTTKLKTEVYGAVAKVINGFIDWYNNSLILRGAIANIALQFKNAWALIKTILKVFVDAVKGLSDLIEGVFTLDWDKVKSGWKNGLNAILKDVASGFEKMKENVADSIDQTVNGKINHIEVPVDVDYSGGSKGGIKPGKGGSSSSGGGNKSGKEEKVVIKTELELKREELKKVNDKVKEAFNDFNDGHITKEKLEEIVKSANEYFEANHVKQKIELDYYDEEGFEKVKQKAIEKAKEIKEAVQKSVPSILAPDTSTFEKGSAEDKFQSLNNANSQAEHVRDLLSKGIISKEQAAEEIEKIKQALEEAFPGEGLTLDLHVNADGALSTVAEDLETAKNRIDSISGAVGTMGGVFSSLGSAVGGTSGEILNFAGTTISAVGQMIPQIVGLIAAQNAEAIAAGTASGAALPFPANIAAIASIIATIAGIFASLPKFAEGGIVAGGSYTGDKVLARLNSGEGVLTRRGMNNLETVMNNQENSGGFGGKVVFDIDGTKLRGVLANVNKKILKQS